MSEDRRFSESELERARRSGIVSLVGAKVKLSRKGKAAYWGCCPFHDEKSPSFKVEGERYHCFGCNADGDAISWLKETQGLSFTEAVTYLLGGKFPERDDPEPRPNGKVNGEPVNGKSYGSIFPLACPVHPKLGRPHQTFEYFTEDGKQIGFICRWNTDKGKDIRPVTFIDGEWKWQGFPKPHVLYRIPDIISQADRPVLIVEGEKAADAARELVGDMTVTTWPHGALAVAQADWKALRGRSVVLWPDADEPGSKAMRDVGAALREAGALSIRLVKLPQGLPKGWDLADPLPEGLDPVTLIDQARDIASERLATLGLLMADDMIEKTYKPPKWAVPDLVPEGLSILAGNPKTGKSWMALDFAVAVSAGRYALTSVKVDEGDVLYLALEDTERRLQGRLKAVLQGQSAPKRLGIAFNWKRTDDGGVDDLRAWLSVYRGARLVIIDTLQKIRGARKKEAGVYEDDYRAVAELKTVADEFAVAIVVIHHLNKAGNSDPILSVSGSAGITGSADTVLVLDRQPNDPNALLKVRGRDVGDEELAVQFDKETGRWARLGKGQDWRLSEARKAVIAVIVDLGPLSPKEIGLALGKKGSSTRMLLAKMVRDNSIVLQKDGKYNVPD